MKPCHRNACMWTTFRIFMIIYIWHEIHESFKSGIFCMTHTKPNSVKFWSSSAKLANYNKLNIGPTQVHVLTNKRTEKTKPYRKGAPLRRADSEENDHSSSWLDCRVLKACPGIFVHGFVPQKCKPVSGASNSLRSWRKWMVTRVQLSGGREPKVCT